MGMRRVDTLNRRRNTDHPYMSKTRIRERVMDAMGGVSNDEVKAIADAMGIKEPVELSRALKMMKLSTQDEIKARLKESVEAKARIDERKKTVKEVDVKNKTIEVLEEASVELKQLLSKAKTEAEKKKILSQYASRGESPKIEGGEIIANGKFNIELWIEQRANALKRRNLLMTDRQLNDLEMSRKYRIGDRAKFIGDTRVENIGNEEIERLCGQIGTITEAGMHVRSQIVRFRPKNSMPDLVVREHTPGFLDLERITEDEYAELTDV